MTDAGQYPTHRPRAIVFAFACEPGRGSEPGAGWGVVRALSDVADCTVLVGKEHERAIREWEKQNPRGDALRFVVLPDGDDSARARRGRLAWFAAYLRWSQEAQREATALHQQRPFDVACHATYSTYWLPSPATSLGIPCLWGPVGGAVKTPRSLWPLLGASGVLEEIADQCAVRLCAMLPAVRDSWWRATVRIVQNEATRDVLPVSLRADTMVLNHALLVDLPPAKATMRARDQGILFAGALERRKGCELALHALAHTPHWLRLTVAGDGPERRTLERVAQRLGVGDRVVWLGNVPRSRLFELLDGTVAALFTGLREEGGLALAEAMARGTPVIVLAHGGARTIAASTIDPLRVALVEPTSPDPTAQGLAAAMIRMASTATLGNSPLLDQATARRSLGAALMRAISLGEARKGSNTAVADPIVRHSEASANREGARS